MTLRNVVLITIDCLRADHLNCYGYKPHTSGYISELAQKGLVFTNMYANSSYTCASVASFITSTYPFDYGEYFEFSTPAVISKKRTLLSQVLKKHGYSCGFFHDNPYLSSMFGYGRGFDSSVDFGEEGSAAASIKNVKIRRFLSRLNRLYLLYKKWYRKELSLNTDAETILQAASKWIHRDNSEPFFLWCHLMDSHTPYTPKHELLPIVELTKARAFYLISKNWALRKLPSEGELALLKKLYDLQITYIDRMLQRYLPLISEGLENTVVVITADHGEEFMENGMLGHARPLSDLLLRIPLIIAGSTLKQRVVKHQASLIDLAPTILELGGVKKYAGFKGKSLLQLEKSKSVIAQGIFNGEKQKRVIRACVACS